MLKKKLKISDYIKRNENDTYDMIHNDTENIDVTPDLTSYRIKYKRNNQDNKVNKYSRKLVDYCI